MKKKGTDFILQGFIKEKYNTVGICTRSKWLVQSQETI